MLFCTLPPLLPYSVFADGEGLGHGELGRTGLPASRTGTDATRRGPVINFRCEGGGVCIMSGPRARGDCWWKGREHRGTIKSSRCVDWIRKTRRKEKCEVTRRGSKEDLEKTGFKKNQDKHYLRKLEKKRKRRKTRKRRRGLDALTANGRARRLGLDLLNGEVEQAQPP